MNQKTLDSKTLQETVDAVYQHGSISAAADMKGIARSTMKHRYHRALNNGFTPRKDVEPDIEHRLRLAEDRNKALETQLQRKHSERAIEAWVRNELFKMVQTPPTPPSWVNNPGKMAHSSPGTPFLALGDWHWGEVIDPNQIDGLNEYNINIAHRRAKNVIDTAVDLLQHHMVKPDYPGIVVSLLGDMVSGDIHQELQETNELPTIPTVLDVVGVMQQSLKYLADQFGRVHVVCVVGNHGRNCYDENTEILTRRGWLRVDQVDFDKDEVAAFDPRKDTICFEKPAEWYYDADYWGAMVSVESKGVSLFVTPEHTLWVKAPGSKHDLKTGKKTYEYPFSQRLASERTWSDVWAAQCGITGWAGEVQKIVVPSTARTPEFIIEPDAKWAEFFGWYVSEGCADEGRITISQSAEKNPKKYARIAALLTAMSFDPKLSSNVIRVGKSGLARFLNDQFGAGAGNKRLPRWLKAWPKDLLSAFFDAAMDGDGCWEKRGGRSGRYTSTSDTLLDDMQEIAFKLGYSSNLGDRYVSSFGDSGYEGTARKLGVTRTPYRSMCKSTIVQYRGAIWCPSVSTGLVVVRRNGKAVVSGNTKKMQAKGRTATSFDWLSYKILELQCNDDDRITFQIPDGADTRLRVYSHDYLITHGDQFRGGDGIIGPLGPLVRGDYKKRLRESMVDSHYDTMVCGHFHRLITLSQLIVNGSLVGYNEYAYTANFPYEPPRQALWVTHPRNGITFTLPVLAEKLEKKADAAKWLSLPA